MTQPTEPRVLAPDTIRKLGELAARWTDVGAAERANYSLYLIELCDAIGVERPRPAAAGGRSAEGVAYQFEFPVRTTTRDGAASMNFIDLYKAECFALEAKDAVGRVRRVARHARRTRQTRRRRVRLAVARDRRGNSRSVGGAARCPRGRGGAGNRALAASGISGAQRHGERPARRTCAYAASVCGAAPIAPVQWPAEEVEQIGALKRIASAGTVSVDEAARHFQGAKRDIVARHLETLEILGEVRVVEGGRYAAASGA